jgi:hypothetical protein
MLSVLNVCPFLIMAGDEAAARACRGVRAVKDTAVVDETARREEVRSEDEMVGGERGRDTAAEQRGKAARDKTVKNGTAEGVEG